MKKISLAILCLFQAFTSLISAQVNIIPAPAEMKLNKGFFEPGEVMPVYIDKSFLKGELLLQNLNYFAQIQPVISPKKVKKGIVIAKPKMALKAESYLLLISKKGIRIEASDDAGVFYAFQTLRQLRADNQSFSHDGKEFQKRVLGQIPCLTIKDSPAFKWRGMHLDVSRHFYGVEKVKKYLDLMALHKMNVFHWHLTDDQGWRIEIKKYPALTSVGSKRNGSMVGKYSDQVIDSIPYGGFYTQNEIKEIVKYAQNLFITVVPEIEMPGHCQASMAAYPEYSCMGGTFEVGKKWGGYDDPYCAGKDSTFVFLQDILSEIFTLFPSEYIHIGGDECPKARWKECPRCQLRMKNEGLKDEFELQSYFIRRIEKFLNQNNKKLMGWDEILEGGLAPNAAVMSWRGTEGGIAAAQTGHYVVMSPGKPLYFDHYQSKDSTEPIAIGGYNPLEKVFIFNPLSGLDTAASKYVLGAQANVWTEYIYTWEHVEYMVFPRQCALADALWKGGTRGDYNAFLAAWQVHRLRLNALNVNYAKHDVKD